jgi:ubiquinone/menaquinone biosynthesis C-methylase UbiE
MDSKSLSRQRYSRRAQGYVTSETHARGNDLDRLLEITSPRPEWTVLDIATGGGHTALKLAPFVKRVIASDLTLEMLAAARGFLSQSGLTNITFQAADAENLPFKNEVFNLVTCRLAPHHFPDCPRFVRESARVLKHGGILVVDDHVLPEDIQVSELVERFEKLRDPSHNRAFNVAEWRGMFEEAGLQVKLAELHEKRAGFLDWVKRQACPPEVVGELERMLREAPQDALDWMQPQDWGSPEASFLHRFIIISGRK